METLELNKVEIKSPDQRKIMLNTGIEPAAREQIADGLKVLLADSYCLMLMSQNYHWNVQGPNFHTIHEMTESHYNELFEAIDEIAERIRALGFLSPGTMNAFNEMTNINIPNSELSEQEMIADLLEGHETLARNARQTLPAAAKANDEVTVDLLTQRMEYHEKTSWMLRSMLER